MIIGKYNKSVILTYVGLMFALVGIYCAFNDMISYSMICLILSGICDLFDGKVARMCKRDDIEKEFGIQIDSLVDVVSFLALPFCIGIKMFNNMPKIANIVFIFYVLAGVIRLAWFNLNANKNEAVKTYTGLPVTYSAIILPIIYAINLIFQLQIQIVYLVVYMIVGLAFILNVKVIKPTGIWYVICAFAAIAVSTIIIMMG